MLLTLLEFALLRFVGEIFGDDDEIDARGVEGGVVVMVVGGVFDDVGIDDVSDDDW